MEFVINDMNETYARCEGKSLFIYINKSKLDFVVRANGSRVGHSWPGNGQSKVLISHFEQCGLDVTTPARYNVFANGLQHTILIA